MARFCSLFSSSSGNSVYIGHPGGGILIDIGVSAKRETEALNSVGASVESIGAVFVTHEHSDHVSGVRVFAGRNNKKVYASQGTLAGMEDMSILDGKYPAEVMPESGVEVNDSGTFAGGRDTGYFLVWDWGADSAKEYGWFNIPNGFFSGVPYERVYVNWEDGPASALQATAFGGAWGFVDRFTGEALLPFQEEWSLAGTYSEGCVPVRRGQECALMDREGNAAPLPAGYVYPAFEPVAVSEGLIQVTDAEGNPVRAEVAVSIFDKAYLYLPGHENIMSHSYLSEQIRGDVFNPAYYFDETNADRLYALDLLLMTQGWRRYVWDE